jgi:hypothetical protein
MTNSRATGCWMTKSSFEHPAAGCRGRYPAAVPGITLDNQFKYRTAGEYQYRPPVEAGVTRKA